MKKMIMVKQMAVLGLFVLSLVAVPAMAEYVYDANMTSNQVVPASSSTGYGHATLIMNDAMTEVAYTVNYAGLDATQTAAGFFLGSPGTVGTEAMALQGGAPFAGIWQIDPAIASALLAESVYVNIFSDASRFPAGEIRGNFTLTMVENEPSNWGSVKALYR